jgi:superfamily I DNA and RNA helicase
VAIGGCAGSGKTMLAVQKARQFSELGMNVLLICFNAPLAEYLRRRLPNIDVYHFHELCRQAAKRVELLIPRNIDDQEYFENVLPEALLKAADTIGRVYDAIIIDEGQDFKENYWIAIESLLKENGYLYIFYDNNQNLYEGALDFGGLIQEQPCILTQNCRNTQLIHKAVANYHSNPKSINCSGSIGIQR